MIKISEVTSADKQIITADILKKLPQWFGIDSAINDYVSGVKETVFLAAYDDEKPVGFISIKSNNEYTAEIYVMGIEKPYHRKGIGTILIEKAQLFLKNNGYRFLMVKTLGESCDYEFYARTRMFYKKCGFFPLQEIKEIWGEENPCLIMIKVL
ncbi:MAG TPA: GNAT family N-acetyltransferase [Petrotogaceae bacterium]|jgi:GNAT superfamily N-acetyltransferase|nr:GNAT family N-acetyltransferase [Petrotogaceae bacterium]HQF32313.1 GNAT family N-acetyltransferase [Petrotogaceae bacterium]HQH33491.1 GNAT family N-acetyltransferase [Petrotogaceae bacterium]HQI78362.1 GNAT family N-acetyltransferase [Petrotogaceae bacterium]